MGGRKKTPDEQLAFDALPAPNDAASTADGAKDTPVTIRLYLVDASAYVYRAFHAIPFLSTSRSQGGRRSL